MTLRFLPLSSAFLPLFNCSAQVAGISSPRFCHQFMLAAAQGCLGLASLSPFTADSSIIPTISSLPFPTQIAPSPWASFSPQASRTICYHCHRQMLLFRPVLYILPQVLQSSLLCTISSFVSQEWCHGQTPSLTDLTTPLVVHLLFQQIQTSVLLQGSI